MSELIAVDSLYILSHWDLNEVFPKLLKRIKVPEDANLGYVSCLKTLGFNSSDQRNMNHAYIGTTTGNLYFYSLEDKALLRHSVKRQQLL